MTLGQDLQRRDEIPDFLFRRPDAKSAAVLLQHVHARSAVRRVHHQVHDAVRFQHGAKRPQSSIRIGEVMQHTRAHNQIESPIQIAGAFDRPLPDLEIREVVLLLQLLGVIDARRADVDADDARVGPAESVLRRLPRAASGDEDVQTPGTTVGPEQWYSARGGSRAPLVAGPIGLSRGRIRMSGVEVANRIRTGLGHGAATLEA